jgi:hypothetical protein
MRRVGADPEQLFDRRPLQVIDNAGFRLALPKLPAPLNVAWGLLANATVPLGWKGQKPRGGWKASTRQGFRLTAKRPSHEWLDAAGQTGILRRHLWEPLCLAALNTPAERASAQLFANVLRDSLGSPRREDTDLLLPRVPLGELLPEPAGRWLQAHGCELRWPPRRPNPEPTRARHRHRRRKLRRRHHRHRPATRRRNSGRPAHADYDYEPIATVYLQFGPKNQNSLSR